MRNCYGLIYSVAIRKICARQQRVDEHYQLGVCAIGVAKKAPPKKRDVHRAEVIGTSWIIDRARDLGHGCRLARTNPEWAFIRPLAHWHERRNVACLYAGNLPNALDQLLVRNPHL